MFTFLIDTLKFIIRSCLYFIAIILIVIYFACYDLIVSVMTPDAWLWAICIFLFLAGIFHKK